MTSRLGFAIAFPGMLMWAAAAPACASQASSANPPRVVEAPLCRVVAPTYLPVGRKREAIVSVTFPGGARLRFLVAAPCYRPARAFDV